MSDVQQMQDTAIEQIWRDGLKAIDEQYDEAETSRLRWVRIGHGLLVGRQMCPADQDYGKWVDTTGYRVIARNERQDAMWLAFNEEIALPAMTETRIGNPQNIRKHIREKLSAVYAQCKEVSVTCGHVTNSEKSLSPKPEVSAPVTRPSEKIVLAKPVVEAPKSIETFPVLKDSKLHDLLPAKVATVLQERFKHARIFIKIAGESDHSRTLLGHLAKRCLEPDYPEPLFYTKAWTLQLLYPHLPQKYLDNKYEVPAKLSTLYGGGFHKELVEAERLFKLAPEFASRVEKPALACNTVHAIRSSLRQSKNGHAPDPAAVHRVTYAGDEGKPKAIIRGTQVWPAESDAGYGYHDLRCAWGLAADILCTFGEPRDVPIATKTLKLRHAVSWFPGGYNAHGATFEGLQRALQMVIHAYTLNKSDVMLTPITLATDG